MPNTTDKTNPHPGASSGFKPSLASLNHLMQKTRRRREARDKGAGGEGVREGMKEEEEKASMTPATKNEEKMASIIPASYSLRADSIDLHFLYVSLIFIQHVSCM